MNAYKTKTKTNICNWNAFLARTSIWWYSNCFYIYVMWYDVRVRIIGNVCSLVKHKHNHQGAHTLHSSQSRRRWSFVEESIANIGAFWHATQAKETHSWGTGRKVFLFKFEVRTSVIVKSDANRVLVAWCNHIYVDAEDQQSCRGLYGEHQEPIYRLVVFIVWASSTAEAQIDASTLRYQSLLLYVHRPTPKSADEHELCLLIYWLLSRN